MSRTHKLDEKEIHINCGDKNLERVKSYKLLGITVDEHMTFYQHVNELVKTCYMTLHTLKKLKRYTPFAV